MKYLIALLLSLIALVPSTTKAFTLPQKSSPEAMAIVIEAKHEAMFHDDNTGFWIIEYNCLDDTGIINNNPGTLHESWVFAHFDNNGDQDKEISFSWIVQAAIEVDKLGAKGWN